MILLCFYTAKAKSRSILFPSQRTPKAITVFLRTSMNYVASKALISLLVLKINFSLFC